MVGRALAVLSRHQKIYVQDLSQASPDCLPLIVFSIVYTNFKVSPLDR